MGEPKVASASRLAAEAGECFRREIKPGAQRCFCWFLHLDAPTHLTPTTDQPHGDARNEEKFV